MQKPSVLYYLHTYFMDNAIEQIKILSQLCDLHLVIELSLDSLTSTIIDFSSYNLKSGVHPISTILDYENSKKLDYYFKNLKSVHYAFYPSRHMIGIRNVRTFSNILTVLKKYNVKVIHFDTTSGRLLPLIPFLYRYKKYATIHDPIPHAGEFTFKKKLIALAYQSVINKYLFYSNFAVNQFKSVYPSLSSKLYTARLLPYSYIKHFNAKSNVNGQYVLYFGRLSYYKGIDILINAFDNLWVNYPNLKLVIAGKPHGSYQIDLLSGNRKNNIIYFQGYVKTDELQTLIKHALFVVCPYREATQSGVLMTAIALNKPVLATRVGSFPEYIQSGKNGLLSNPDEKSLLDAMENLLENNLYKNLEYNMRLNESNHDMGYNLEVYRRLYNITK